MSDTPAICAEGIHFTYPPLASSLPLVPVLIDLSLALAAGECLVVTGANGAGKSTLCQIVTALSPQITGGELRGKLQVLGQNLSGVHPATLAGRVGISFQEVEHQLFNASVEAEIAWGLETLGLPPAEIEDRIRWAMAVVGLQVDPSRPPASLSGGQQRRLALAVALAPHPQLLVLDEPLGGLDPAGSREVLAALAALREESRAAILITESQTEAVLSLADRFAVLDQGRVAAEGSPLKIFGVPQEGIDALDRMGVATPQLARLSARLRRGRWAEESFLTLEKAEASLRGIRLGDPAAPAAPRSQQAQDRPPAIRFEKLSFHYPDNPPVLHAITLSIPAGQFVALVGANGSGKTTLAKQVIGLLRPTAGQVWVEGQDAAEQPVGQLARRVGYLFQHPERQIFAPTVREEVAFGPRNLGLEEKLVGARVEAALARFGLNEMASAPPAILSYALRRLVTLASVAAMEPAILVLDEPTVGLDAPGRRVTLEWAGELHRAGRTVLLITHDMPAASRAERMVVLQAGRIIAQGAPAELFWQPELLNRAALAPPPVAALAQRLGLPAGVLDIDGFVQALAPPTHAFPDREDPSPSGV